LEPIRQDLYDTKLQASLVGLTGSLDFFKTPAAGDINSNMQASGQLPHPQQFHAFGLACEILPGEDETAPAGVSDAWVSEKKKVRETSWLRLRIGSKDYLTIPLKRVPEGLGPAGVGGSVFAAIPPPDGIGMTAITNGIQDLQHYYDLTIRQHGKVKPIHIPAQQSLTPTLEMRFRVYLVGILWREVQ
jgi:hypothetical protein